MKYVYISALILCLAVAMLTGCGQSGPGTPAENAGDSKDAASEDSGSSKVSKAAFDGMIDDWIKRNKAKMGGELSPKQFRSSLQSWFDQNKDKINRGKFSQKDFDVMVAKGLQALSEQHGHAH